MSDAIQMTPAVSQSNVSSTGDGSKQGSSEQASEFNAMFNNYVESENDGAEVNPAGLVNTDLPPELLLTNDTLPDPALLGNTLPQEENNASWQAMMLLQPSEKLITNPEQMQLSNLIEQQRKSQLNSGVIENSKIKNTLSADYLNSMTSSSQVSEQTPGNIQSQLAAVHFTPDTNESLLVSMNEQLAPVQGTNSNLTQGLAAVGLGTAVQAASTQSQAAPLNLGQAAWEGNFASRLQMMVGQNVQSAEIRLDPPELGALDIKIKVSNDVATINITSPHSQVREALETAVPRLREMFAESGLSLGDVNVRQESFSQQEKATGDEAASTKEVANADYLDEPVTEIRKIERNGLLDIYA